MKVTGETTQPIVIDTEREEARALGLELSSFDLHGKPRLTELRDMLIEAERRFREREYGGPG